MSADGEKSIRLDKWLWAARFFKTRQLAADAVSGGKVIVEGQRVKPRRQLLLGERLTVRRGQYVFDVQVVGISKQRGPATKAQQMYLETTESLQKRADMKRHLQLESLYFPRSRVRPDKKVRRQLINIKKANS